MLTFKQFLYDNTKMERLGKILDVPGSELDKMGEKEVYSILKNIGKHDFTSDSEFDPTELRTGIEVEKEHTDSVLVAKLIAKDHLKENPKYYSRLLKFEKRGKKHEIT